MTTGKNPTSPTPVNVDVAQASRLIKSALVRKFPHSAFTVRSSRFSGGSSISVRWIDGPTEAMVAPVAKLYEHIRRDPRSGEELLGGNRHVELYRDFSGRRRVWAHQVIVSADANFVPPSASYYVEDLLARTSFDVPEPGAIRTRSR